MPLALLLAVVGTLCRVVPHPWNAVPMGAICLYAGARLPRRWALAVPILAMLGSDVIASLRIADGILDALVGVLPGMTAVLATSYATFAAIAWFGGVLKADAGPATRIGSSLGASTVFFLTSNFAVWASGACGDLYSMDLAGLGLCFAQAIPFFGNGVLADLIGTAALFGGLDWVVRRAEKPAALPEAA